MKKTLILASLITFVSVPVAFANEQNPIQQPITIEKQKPEFVNHKSFKKHDKQKFEERLKLTDEQKAQAQELRKQSFERIKPVMEQIKLKKEEIKAIKLSKIAIEEQELKITELKNEMKALHRQAHEIKMQNMKDFEAILTKKQKKELAKMKKEGRKKFDKEHKRKHHPKFKSDFQPKFNQTIPAPPKPLIEK